MLPGRPYARRTLIAGAGAAGALVTALVAPSLAGWAGYPQLTRSRAVWMAATAEIVFAVYKWGVGSWSRYEPPPASTLRPGGPAAT
jgi:nitrate/nitrite transporter NarK